MADKLYDDARVFHALKASRDPDVDWSEVGPELAFLLQETRREMFQWMMETRHATEISDAWKKRYQELTELLEELV